MFDIFNPLHATDLGILPVSTHEHVIYLSLPVANISGGDIPNPPKQK
jgi:hypothetical protein